LFFVTFTCKFEIIVVSLQANNTTEYDKL
jgi:hypothetical protein